VGRHKRGAEFSPASAAVNFVIILAFFYRLRELFFCAGNFSPTSPFLACIPENHFSHLQTFFNHINVGNPLVYWWLVERVPLLLSQILLKLGPHSESISASISAGHHQCDIPNMGHKLPCV
jgi:hypothetical protein